MDGRIGHLHCRFRVYGDRAEAIPARLERVARERLAEAWGDALGLGLGDDPAVYVLRRVETAITIRDDGRLTDGALAERWAARLAGAVVRRIATDDGGQDLVRFEDTSEYLARFLVDVLRGTAWDRWFYGAFADLRHRSRADVLRGALLRNRAQSGATLRRLRASGDLEALLRALDPDTLRDLWGAAGAERDLDLAAARSVFMQAVDLADWLGLWAGGRTREDALAAYLAALTGPSNGPGRGGQSLPADWQDPRSLAATIVDITEFLSGRGYLREPVDGTSAGFTERLDAALARLDWADTGWLRRAILTLFGGETHPGASSDLPARKAGESTPRQRDLLADLLAVVRAGGLMLDPANPDGPANGLRLQTALTAYAGRWDGDPAATAMIRHLLGAWAALARGRTPWDALQQLRDGDIAAVERSVTAGGRDLPGVGSLAVLGKLGEPALVVVERLLGEPESAAGTAGTAGAMRGFDTQAAGLFFLLRTILDLRLPWLLRESGYPVADPADALGAVLLEIGLRLAEDAALDDDGLLLFAGIERPLPDDALLARWAGTDIADDDRFQEALFGTLVRQNLLGGDTLHVSRIDLGSGREALVGGEDGARIWPFGRLLEPGEPVKPIVAAWRDAAERSTGRRPVAVAGGGEQALLPARAVLGAGIAGRGGAELTLDLAAIAIVRVWARWLRHFAGSSTPYLVTTFLRRPGWIGVDPETVLVEPETGALDVVLELAGYLEDLERVPWLDGRRVRIRS